MTTRTTVHQDVEFRWTRGTSARWSIVNPILSAGEPGYETDTKRFKVGDGFKPWNDLTYSAEIDYGGSASIADTRIGDMSDLTTEEKTSIVGAINELNYEDVSLLLFYNNAKEG